MTRSGTLRYSQASVGALRYAAAWRRGHADARAQRRHVRFVGCRFAPARLWPPASPPGRVCLDRRAASRAHFSWHSPASPPFCEDAMRKSDRKSKRERFVEEYLKDTNGAQAAIRAGYAPHTADRTAYELL